MTDEPNWLDKFLDIRRIQKYLKGNADYRKSVSDRIDQVETAQERILEPTQDMVRAHLAFLDHLTKEDTQDRKSGVAYETSKPRDYRLEFVTFYLTHRDMKRPMNRPARRDGE